MTKQLSHEKAIQLSHAYYILTIYRLIRNFALHYWSVTLLAIRVTIVGFLPFIVAFVFPAITSADQKSPAVPLEAKLTVDDVWAGTGTGYDAISVGNMVYIAYYDADRQLSVARIDTTSGHISKRTLGSVFGGWDAHNYVTLVYDKFGYLHVAGNMHTSPLVYARMLEADSFDSLTRLASMVGQDEVSVTYPKFFALPNGELGFTYRSGRSGDGVEFINKFDGQSWSRHSKAPIFSSKQGQPSVNAYHTGYIPGPDGYFHVAWVWRLSWKVETNFDVNYARSKDLVHWFSHHGLELIPPLVPTNTDVVEAISPGAGLYNNVKLGFDGFDAPIVSYLKFDESGYTQLYHARPSENGWEILKMTDWRFRWELKGGGTKGGQIGFSGVSTRDGVVTESVKHPDFGSFVVFYTKDAMNVEKVTAQPSTFPRCSVDKPWVHVSQQIKNTSADSYRGRIMWRSLPSNNNDRPRSCDSIGHPEGCRMISTLVLVPSSSPIACAP